MAARTADPAFLALSPEAFEASVHRTLLPKFRRDISDIKVQKRARRKDSHGIRHEFDLWYQYRVGIVVHHVAVEVRRRSRPISLEEMRAFFGKVVDMPQRPVALMVSLAGFQSGARSYATKKGILMYVLRKDLRGRTVIHENPSTIWHGRTNTVRFAASLAAALADATAELRTPSEDAELFRSRRASPPRFPMVETKIVDGNLVLRELPMVWIPPSSRDGEGRIERRRDVSDKVLAEGAPRIRGMGLGPDLRNKRTVKATAKKAAKTSPRVAPKKTAKR